jgi:CheY-like chemotaxis protein
MRTLLSVSALATKSESAQIEFMKTILLVEDNEDIRDAVAELLLSEGYEVITAEHGQAALDQLANMHGVPCLVLLDLMMPVMNGTQLLKVLHDGHRLASLPVVVMSATGTGRDTPEARQHIRKPVAAETLLAVVKEFCGAPVQPSA